MNIFHRTTHSTQQAHTEPQPTEPQEETPKQQETPTAQPDSRTAEEVARSWWKERYGENMPEEVVTWIKQLTRTEARRIHMTMSLLSPQKMARIEDARRLAETKLRNIESSLQRIHDQQEWLHRFNEKKHELTEHRNRLNEVNKQLASMSNEERELLRFEAFESVQGLFQRMTLLERQSRENKLAQSELAHDWEEAQRQVSDGQKMLKQRAGEQDEATKQMLLVRDQLEEANRILGARTILDLDERGIEQLTETVEQQKLILGKEIEEQERTLEGLQDLIGQQSTQRQAMEPHQPLLEHGEMVLTLLGRLHEMRLELESMRRTQDEGIRRQQEENEMLNRVFSDFQNVEADIKTLNAELHLHRQQNLGRSSYSLQERAMQLKTRRQMLLAAQSLWNRISSGYQLIEEKTQTINRLRLSLDNLRLSIDNLEAKVVPMRKLCHEKEYTLTLSKSQNVIQLRGDLKEGVSCTVCGATHHPYHSDTILEQSKLISELRTDYELMQTELAAQEEQLKQLYTEHTAQLARRDVEEEMLSHLRQRQIEDVKEWSVFSHLDRTFGECSSGTNLEARTAMLRQLIENTARDADDAQRELDEYNFHQTRINEITEELTQKEQKKNDLTVRLNEVNTGCQVLARQAEQTRQMRTNLYERYTQLYERLGGYVTLNDWYGQWQANHEALCLRIEQMMEKWKNLNTDIARMEEQQRLIQALLEDKRYACSFLESLIMQIREAREKRRTIRKEDEKTYESLLGEQEVKEYFNTYYQQLLQARHLNQEQQETTHNDMLQLAEKTGRKEELANMGKALDAEAIAQRSQLDVWMRQFNAKHPPVQYAELDKAFATDKDWNAIREQVRAVRIESMLEQARVDSLRSNIVALQAEGVRPSGDDEANAIESLIAQKQQLEKQRQDVLMQLAEQRIALANHEECTAHLKAEEERLYELVNK